MKWNLTKIMINPAKFQLENNIKLMNKFLKYLDLLLNWLLIEITCRIHKRSFQFNIRLIKDNKKRFKI
jgi:hypothetical protein